MDVHGLESFRAVAEAADLGHAARRLGLPRSVVHRRIEHLERDLGVPLFGPGRAPVVLTREGATLLPAVEELLQHAEHVRDLIAVLSGRPVSDRPEPRR